MKKLRFKKILNKLISKKTRAEFSVYRLKKRFRKFAKKRFENDSKIGSFEDYKKALKKYGFTYYEYYQYELFNKSDKERAEFLPLLKISYFYLRFIPDTVYPIFNNKHTFLKTFQNYIHRKWLYSPNATFKEFNDLVSNCNCIVKPDNDNSGNGVQKVSLSQNTAIELYEWCVKNRMLVEEYLEQCDEIKSFHPQSLNTIRVVTVGNKEKAEVFGAIIRVGVGESIVDNAHAGGLFAQINVNEGIIESDGIDVRGNKYDRHPDSQIMFKGYQIPMWNSIVETCCEAAKIVGNTLTGWDVVINSQREIEFVEGNLMPAFDMMQSPLQIGYKKKLYSLIKEYSGVEMK